MRIISKQHDFYDSGIAFSHGHTDNAYIFNRTSEIFNPTRTDSEKLYKVIFDDSFDSEVQKLYRMDRFPMQFGVHNSDFAKFGYLAFCGRIYPFVQLNSNTHRNANWQGLEACNKLFSTGERTDNNINTVTFYGKESALRFIEKLHENNYFKFGMNNKSEYEHWVDFINIFFKLAPKPFNSQFAKDYSIQIGSPYFTVSDLSHNRSNRDKVKITKTPILKLFQFQKILDANTTYQEISMFFCGVIGNTEKETITISDTDLRDAKGFNDKSFKAEKSTKRRKQK